MYIYIYVFICIYKSAVFPRRWQCVQRARWSSVLTLHSLETRKRFPDDCTGQDCPNTRTKASAPHESCLHAKFCLQMRVLLLTVRS